MLQKFYEDVLPRHGHLCLFTIPSNHHHWAGSIPELVTLTAEIERRYRGEDMYFATAGFKVKVRKQENADGMRCLRVDLDAGPEKVAKHGPERVYADQRAAVAGLMAFVADTKLVPTWIVSSGVGLHVYWCFTQDVEPREWQPLADALKALCRVKGLKADASITADAARVLRPIGTVHVKSGGTVTVIKHTGRRWTSAELRATLAQQVEVLPPGQRRYQHSDPFASLGPTPVKGDTSINADAMPVYEPSNATLVADQCAVMGHIRDTGGQVREPLWHAMMGVVKFTMQGEEAAHKWSDGYAGYDFEETQRKYDAWEAGPTTCKHIAEHSDLCATCPHAGKIVTPVELGRARKPAPEPPKAEPETEAEPQAPEVVTFYGDWMPPPASARPWEGHLPEMYRIDVVGKRRTLMALVPEKNEDGTLKTTDDGSDRLVPTKKVLTNQPFWFTGWTRVSNSDDHSMLEYKVLLREEDDVPQTLHLSASTFSNPIEMSKQLLGRMIVTKEPKLMQAYILDSIEKIRHLTSRPHVSDRMGLRYLEDGQLVAVHGRHVIYKNQTIKSALVKNNVENAASTFALPLAESPSGEYDKTVWIGIEARARRYLDFLGTHVTHPKMQLAVALAIASPLLAFVSDTSYAAGETLPGTGLTVSLFSRKSGTGKTTTADIAMLAYGHPNELNRGGAAISSTPIARSTRMSQNGTMPLFVDEVGRAGPEDAANMVDTVANGSARARATREGGQQKIVPWALIALITTNVSARMMISSVQEASDAIQARLLEINVDDVPGHTPEQIASFRDEWTSVSADCCGALGAILHREIVSMPVDIRHKAEQLSLRSAQRALKAEQSGRFVYRALAAMLMMHTLLDRAGFALPFDMIKEVVPEFKVAYDHGLEFIESNIISSDPCRALAQFVHDSNRNALVTNIIARNGHENAKVVVYNQRIPDRVDIRYGRDDQVMLVSVEALRQWCRDKGIEIMAMIKHLDAHGIVSGSSKSPYGLNQWANTRNMLSGVPSSTPGKIYAFRIDAKRLSEAMGEEVDIPVVEAPPSNVVPLNR